MMPQDQKLALAEELLEDIETGRLRGQPLILKATRLARYLDNEGLQKFLRWELHGYPEDDEVADDMLSWTGRKGWNESNPTFRQSLASLVVFADQQEARLDAITGREATGEWAFAVTQGDKRERVEIMPGLNRIQAIEAAVVAWIHELVAHISFELAFSTRQASLFATAQQAVDARLAVMGGGALERIEATYQRLADGEDAETVSQALNTCRRLIVAVADSIYPATEEPVERDGQSIGVTQEHVLNRIELFVSDHSESGRRRKRLKHAVRDLWERVSAGVHSEVTAEEARFLFLHTYVVLGEIVLLAPTEDIPPPTPNRQT